MSAGVIGVIIGIVVGFSLGGIAYFTGWSAGWDDCKKFIYTELDKIDDERMVYIVRRMADELKGKKND